MNELAMLAVAVTGCILVDVLQRLHARVKVLERLLQIDAAVPLRDGRVIPITTKLKR